MAEVPLDQAPQRVKDLFHKGMSAFERGNLEYAMDLLAGCLEEEPGMLQARKFLRAAALQKVKKHKPGLIKKLIETLSALPQIMKAMSQIRSGRADEALVSTEKLLRVDPLNMRFVLLFADAAAGAKLPEAAIQTLEIVRDHYPNDLKLLNCLGSLYLRGKNTKDARDVFERVAELRPKDPAAIKALKDAMALDSMSSDGWSSTADSGGTFREVMKDEKEAVQIERQAKAVKSDTDADSLIVDLEGQIKADPQNVNHYRALARLYGQRKMFDEGMEVLGRAVEMNKGDPELAQAVSTMRVSKYEYEIRQLAEAGDEEGAAAMQKEKEAFQLADLHERVKRYPNDLKLRRDLGMSLFEQDDLNGAIQQFQLSQRSPKHRVESLYYLAMCFKAKQQYDMASEQLETASSEILTMDETKKNILYELGSVAELVGDRAKATGFYKQIYQVDIGFRDVATKVEQGYQK